MTEKKPINPHEGASPAVDASGPQPARHDYSGLCFELRKSAHFLGMANERPGLIEHCKNAADALDAQAAEIAELKAARHAALQAEIVWRGRSDAQAAEIAELKGTDDE